MNSRKQQEENLIFSMLTLFRYRYVIKIGFSHVDCLLPGFGSAWRLMRIQEPANYFGSGTDPDPQQGYELCLKKILFTLEIICKAYRYLLGTCINITTNSCTSFKKTALQKMSSRAIPNKFVPTRKPVKNLVLFLYVPARTLLLIIFSVIRVGYLVATVHC